MLAAVVLTASGVIALTIRESEPHPGRTGAPRLLAVGFLLYVTPFAFGVDRAMRRGTTRMTVVAVIGVAGAVFLASRPIGSFSHLWPVFTVMVSFIAMMMIGQLIRAGLLPGPDRRGADQPGADPEVTARAPLHVDQPTVEQPGVDLLDLPLASIQPIDPDES